jgi:hypothetical protein
MADTDTDISVSANWISVSAISVSASVSANIDIGYIGIGQISVEIHGYRPKYRHISAKIPVIYPVVSRRKCPIYIELFLEPEDSEQNMKKVDKT